MPFKSDKQRRWMHANKPEIAREWEKHPYGGFLAGNSHEEGGVPIEAEGGEFIIKKDSVNPSTLYMLEYINEYGGLPVSNAKNRRKK
tara:strand:- start:2643 stop:2903 length:261 start_codon:yes stop_codon:yes gene_type:complete